MRGQDDDLEKQLDIDLLHANISGFLIEFMQNRSWQYNPILYLKIAFIGLDHALHKPSASLPETIERTISRLSEIPRILRAGGRQHRYSPRCLLSSLALYDR